MSIHIYNSLSRKKEELSPLDGKTIKMYSCGVTVYDKCHIGHARSLYIFDVIRKYLAGYSGYAVKFVRNITDVDDKIINKANELNKSFDEVVDENIKAYERDLENLGVGQADVEPRATQYIPKMITFIEGLIEKDCAYEADGDVYYNVRQFKDYGKLSGQSVDQMIEATRIEQDPKKRDPLDFALWKKAKEGEKSWDSPWGEGRPGWHIECSCMSMNELESDTIDIHAGGRDLIFPHHENEIAQSEALTGETFARHWIHHGLLTINGQKMAKSVGNFITLDEALAKYTRDILKLFFLQSHYASPVDFSWEKMEEVSKGHERIAILMTKLSEMNLVAGNVRTEWSAARHNAFHLAMEDDFNTPKALSVIYDMVGECNKLIDGDTEEKKLMLREAMDFIKEASDIFGVNFIKSADVTSEEEKLLQERVEARKNKDFQKSDELRDLLKEKGITVEDTKDGQVWRRA